MGHRQPSVDDRGSKVEHEQAGKNLVELLRPSRGGQVSILVAGMLAGSTYHMRAQVQLSKGTTVFRDRSLASKCPARPYRDLPGAECESRGGTD